MTEDPRHTDRPPAAGGEAALQGGERIRLRAVLIGALLALIICLITPFNNAYLQGTPLGGAMLQRSRHAEAVPHFRETLGIRPDHLEAAYNLACALMDLGRLDEAAATLDAAMRLHPDSAPIRGAAARLRWLQQRTTQPAATAPASRPA